MGALVWDNAGEKLYETGVEMGVLYPQAKGGTYPLGVAWNGLSKVTESPSGAEATAIWADNAKYLNLISAEDFGATVEAYMYPDEFKECDGSKEIAPGVYAGQQTRRAFGMAYKTKLGNDTEGEAYGYKLHIIYNAMAKPSERGYSTTNDSPEAMALSWELSTTPVQTGIANIKVTAHLEIDSTKYTTETKKNLEELEKCLFGYTHQGSETASDDIVAFLPLPGDIVALANGTKKAKDLMPKG